MSLQCCSIPLCYISLTGTRPMEKDELNFLMCEHNVKFPVASHYFAVLLDSALLHLAHGHAPYEKRRIKFFLCASTT